MRVFKYQIWIWAICALFLLSSCLPSENKQETTKKLEIIQGHIDGQTYYVPKIYLAPPFSNIGEDNIYVQAMYPDFAPVLKDLQKLWKKEQYYKRIRILAKRYDGLEQKPVHELLEKKIIRLKALEVVNEEYGLVHQKQPEGEVQDLWDLWLEKKEEKYVSYVECSENLTKTSVPQCSLHMYRRDFHIKTSFNKRLLPHWKKIKENTLALLESFQSEETARGFLEERFNTAQTAIRGEE